MGFKGNTEKIKMTRAKLERKEKEQFDKFNLSLAQLNHLQSHLNRLEPENLSIRERDRIMSAVNGMWQEINPILRRYNNGI
jgi:hypothetical protein